jgi:hypothetical protein
MRVSEPLANETLVRTAKAVVRTLEELRLTVPL